jgi:phenol 2-monooxygenase
MTTRFTHESQDVDSVIEPILVLSSEYLGTEQELIPEYFSPFSGKWKIKGVLRAFSLSRRKTADSCRPSQDIH